MGQQLCKQLAELCYTASKRAVHILRGVTPRRQAASRSRLSSPTPSRTLSLGARRTDCLVTMQFQSSTCQAAAAAGTFGVVFHLSIRTVEFEYFMFHFIAALASTFALLIYGLGLWKALLLTASFNSGLICSIIIYRLVFHRCRKFPGPLGAKLTRFYATRLSAKDVQYYKELARMHARYGDFVRTGGCLGTHHDEIRGLTAI
jgi:hypothetical protein